MARRRRDGRRDNENLIFIAFSPSVIFDKMTAPSSEGAYVGQPQGLSLRAVRNYRFTFLRLAKDCKGSNPINNLQKNKRVQQMLYPLFSGGEQGIFSAYCRMPSHRFAL